MATLAIVHVYYLICRRYGKAARFHNLYATFAVKTRPRALHVAIKNKIQYLAELTRLSANMAEDFVCTCDTYSHQASVLDAAYL